MLTSHPQLTFIKRLPSENCGKPYFGIYRGLFWFVSELFYELRSLH